MSPGLFSWMNTGLAAAAEGHGEAPYPPEWLCVFFVLILGSIAVFPLTKAHHWWEQNKNRLLMTVLFSALPVYWYIQHDLHALEHTLLGEYFPFIMLLGSLFVISGGIRLTGDLRATPEMNTALIGGGTLLASFIGTTGASMLLIRPMLQSNHERKYRAHTVIFFIFLVSNIGGCLLPIGDPPLFLGYLAGIPFFWTLKLWPAWLTASVIVLALYYFMDKRYFAKESSVAKWVDKSTVDPLRVHGAINFVWLVGIVLCVIFVNANAKTEFLRTPYLREGIMGLLVVLSLLSTPKGLRKENHFNLDPILEVIILFAGIFVTVIPVLTVLKANASHLGVSTPMEFFWITGGLSSFLDNAPTYFVFFKIAAGLGEAGAGAGAGALIGQGVEQVPEAFLVAISLGAVFLGAMTYIGNGPNFMVKAMAEQAKIPMPSFVGYLKWSCLILLPVFVLVSFLFL